MERGRSLGPPFLVVARGSQGHRFDGFFITTDVHALPSDVASGYGDRWAVEGTNVVAEAARSWR